MIVRQSTARIVTVGPVLDADGVAVTDGVIADFKLSKNGGAPAALNGSATLTHRHTGHYSLALTTSDLDTVGSAEIVIDDTVNACPMKALTVVEEAVYDALYAASANLDGRLPAAAAITNLNTVFNTDFAANYDATNDKWLALIADKSRWWYVATTGNDSNAGTKGAPKLTIAAAITAASSGDTIFINDGTYAETLTINKSLTIIGQSWSAVVSDAKGNGVPLVTVSANGVTLKGFRINETNIGVGLNSNGNSWLTLEDMWIHGGSDGMFTNLLTAAYGFRAYRSRFTSNYDGAVLGRWFSGEVIGCYFSTDATFANAGAPLTSAHACTLGAAGETISNLRFVGNTFVAGVTASSNVNDSTIVEAFNVGERTHADCHGNTYIISNSRAAWSGVISALTSRGSSAHGVPVVSTDHFYIRATSSAGTPTVRGMWSTSDSGTHGYIRYGHGVNDAATPRTGDNIVSLLHPATAGRTLGVESDGDLTKVNTLDGHTPQTGDNFARLGAPAGASHAADAAALKAETALILADTNELQTDWANGGRLDVILDARASQASVDDIPTNAEFNARTLAAASYATATAVADLPTNAELATALDPLATTVELAAATANLDVAVSTRASQTSVDDVPNNAEFQARTLVAGNYATASSLAQAVTDTTVIKAKTDQLTFTVAGHVDCNIEYVNAQQIDGVGSEANPWGPV